MRVNENSDEFTCKKRTLFFIRHGLARILISSLLIICYARAMHEKQQLLILSRFAYVGLVFLIADWWIILMKIHIYQQLNEYFWINTCVAIFILCMYISIAV
jgi:hypothetical protein